MQPHNALSRATQLSRAYANALGLSEGGLERAGETLTPTLPFFDAERHPEYALHREEYLGTINGYVGAAGAGQYGGVGIAVPAASEQLLIIEPGSWAYPENVGALGTVVLYLATEAQIVAALSVGTPVPISRDTRNWSSAGTSRIRLTCRSGDTNAAIGTVAGQFLTHYTNCVVPVADSCLPLVCSPGWGIAWRCGVANIAMRCSIKFRIRRALPGELGA